MGEIRFPKLTFLLKMCTQKNVKILHGYLCQSVLWSNWEINYVTLTLLKVYGPCSGVHFYGHFHEKPQH